MAGKSELAWLAVDTSDLTANQMDKYQAYLGAKQDFENKMQDDARAQGIITAAQSLAFAYRRGLAIAIVERKTQASWSSLAKKG